MQGTPGSYSQHKQPLIYFLSLSTVYISYKGNFTESVFCLLSLDNVFEAYPVHSMSGFLFFIITELYSIIWIYSWPSIFTGFMHSWIQPTMDWKKFFFYRFCFVSLAVPCGLWDLSSLTRPWQWKSQALTIGLLENPPSKQKKKNFNSWKFQKAKLELANSGNYCLNIHIVLGFISNQEVI